MSRNIKRALVAMSIACTVISAFVLFLPGQWLLSLPVSVLALVMLALVMDPLIGVVEGVREERRRRGT